jgi:hypothetical protein
MRLRILAKPIAAAFLFCGGIGVLEAGVALLPVKVEVDMDVLTLGIQSTRTVAINDIFDIALVMTTPATGVSSYGISVNFDNTELTLSGAPASTELLPAGFTFNATPGVASESQVLGQVRTFEAATFGAGPVSNSFTIGTITFKATAPLTDGLFDITPGLFNTGIDGIFDNFSNDLQPVATFTGGKVDVVPEPASAVLLITCGAGALLSRRRRK